MRGHVTAQCPLRVLVLSPFPVAPPVHGGRVRAAGLARGLARAGAEVTVLAPWHPHDPAPPIDSDGVRHRRHRLVASVLPAVLPERVAPAQAMLSLQPTGVGPRRWLDRLGQFDVYQFEFCAQAAWMDLVPEGAAVVYSAHNVERDFAAGGRHGRLVQGVDRIERLERRAVSRSDLVVSCSDADAARLRQLYGAHRSAVLTNAAQPLPGGFDREALRDEARRRLGLGPEHRAILFVGGPGAHNREAVNTLVAEVLPRLGERARLLLAGASARDAPAGDDRILRLGYVEDLGPLLAAADVGVNPVRSSGGTSVKLADYLNGGLPVVATSSGALGAFGSHPSVRTVEHDGVAAALDGDLPEPPPVETGAEWDAHGRELLDELRALPRRGAARRRAPTRVTKPAADAEVAVAVLSLRCEPGLLDAVTSVLEQEPTPEVVVVNSGGGDPRAVLEAAGLDVPVVDRDERLMPGAARNLGVASTGAPYVAFLAADCLAEPGWVAARRDAHRAGAAAVGSLLVNADPQSRSAAASTLLLFHRRMRCAPPAERLPLGVSYERATLERLGGFREDLRTGEDSELNLRLAAAGAPIAVSGDVLTAHRGPRSPAALLRDQYMRGVRRARARASLGLPPPWTGMPLDAVRDARLAWLRGAASPDPAERRSSRRAWPLVVPGALAYAAGAWAGRDTRPPRSRPPRAPGAPWPADRAATRSSEGASGTPARVRS